MVLTTWPLEVFFVTLDKLLKIGYAIFSIVTHICGVHVDICSLEYVSVCMCRCNCTLASVQSWGEEVDVKHFARTLSIDTGSLTWTQGLHISLHTSLHTPSFLWSPHLWMLRHLHGSLSTESFPQSSWKAKNSYFCFLIGKWLIFAFISFVWELLFSGIGALSHQVSISHESFCWSNLCDSVWETFFLCRGGCLARSRKCLGRISCLNRICILFLTKSKKFLFIPRDLLIWIIAIVSLTLIVDFFSE